MTIQEMHYDFRIKKDQVEALNAKAFLDNEIDWLLNQAQLTLIKSKLNILNYRTSGFEQDQKRIEDLKELLVKYPEQDALTLTLHEDEHIYELELDRLRYDYFYFVRAWVEVVTPKCVNKALVKIIQHDDLYHALQDPFNTSDSDRVLANFGRASDSKQASLYLYPNVDHTLGRVYLEYLRYPPKLHLGTYTYIDGNNYPAQDCILSEHLHPEVVNLAVRQAALMNDEGGIYKAAAEQSQLSD